MSLNSKFKLVFMLALIFILIACTSKDNNTVETPDEKGSTPIEEKNGKKASEEDAEDEDENLEEEPVDLLNDLLEIAPEEPTNLEEILAYPSGPLAGKDYRNDLDEMVDMVTEKLPEVKDDASDEELERWYRAYRYLFAEDYPNPNDILRNLSFENFGNSGLEDERFHFKDQMNVLVILDVSGSMANEIDGKPMMDIAKDSINNFVSDLPEEANIGLRVYGHEGKPTGKTKEESCQSTDLVYSIQSLDKQEFTETVNSFEPTGWTPIGLSLEEAKEDFEDFPAEENTNLVYVVSDGAETCGGDPVQAAKGLVDSNIEPIINVIGFNVDIEGQSHLRDIADAGGGIYTDAGDEEQLKEAFERAEEIINQWDEWKKGAKEEVYNEYRDQYRDTLKHYSNWINLKQNERNSAFFTINQLARDDYITSEARDYIVQRVDENVEIYKEVRNTSYEELTETIKSDYEDIKEEIENEYQENTGD